MAQLGDPSPVVGEGDVQQPEPMDPVGVAEEWRSWMQEPGNRQAIMQFGINLMQPMAYGQTAAGHFGQALGAAGEATQRVVSDERAERETFRKEADTESKLNERAGKLQQGETALGIRQQREDLRAIETRSKIETAERRAKLWDEQAALFAAKAKAEPGNAEWSQKLKEAQAKKAEAEAELKSALTAQVPRETDIRERRVETGERKLDLDEQYRRDRMGAELRRLDLRADAIAAQRERSGVMDNNSARRLYQDEVKLKSLIERGYTPPPYEQWIKKFDRTGGAAAPAAAPAPAGTTPAPTARPTATAPSTGSPVGREKEYTDENGDVRVYVKIKPGPDSDKSTWKAD